MQCNGIAGLKQYLATNLIMNMNKIVEYRDIQTIVMK